MKILGNIDSHALGTTNPHYLLLPSGYVTSELNYPVLFLLHGLFGGFRNWLELTDLEQRAEDHRLIIVMPEGGESWYTNSATDVQSRYEDYFIDELIPHVDATYRTLTNRSARAIAGLSMGGYGAFKFALKRSELFCFGASFSGAFDATRRSEESPGFEWEALRPSVINAFGPVNSETRRHNDLWSIAENLSLSKKRKLPFLYFDCGASDGFLAANHKLAAAFSDYGIAHEFNEIEGGHDWLYWNSRVPTLLQMVSSRLLSPS